MSRLLTILVICQITERISAIFFPSVAIYNPREFMCSFCRSSLEGISGGIHQRSLLSAEEAGCGPSSTISAYSCYKASDSGGHG